MADIVEEAGRVKGLVPAPPAPPTAPPTAPPGENPIIREGSNVRVEIGPSGEAAGGTSEPREVPQDPRFSLTSSTESELDLAGTGKSKGKKGTYYYGLFTSGEHTKK